MNLSDLGKTLFEDEIIRVIITNSSKRSSLEYKYTNELNSRFAYPSLIDTERIIGIVGGGEQFLSFLLNQNLKEAIGIDINISQIIFLLLKLSLSYRPKKFLEFSKQLCNDYNLEAHFSSHINSLYYYIFSSLYENIAKNFTMKNPKPKVSLIAADALDVFPKILTENSTLYLSSLPDFVDNKKLIESIKNFIESKCPIIACELGNNPYYTYVGGFTRMVQRTARDNGIKYLLSSFPTFGGANSVFHETIYFLRAEGSK